MSDKVYIERPEVTAEREAGWVNFHPEDICHACGGDNPRWHADPEQWYQAMDVRDTDAGGIVCPNCFIALWHDTTDREVIWHLSIMEVTSSDIGPTSSDIERDSEGVGDCARCNGFGVIPGETSRDLPPLCPVCEVDGLLRSAGRIDIAKRIAAALAALPAPAPEGVPEDHRVCSHGIYHHGCPSCDRQDPEDRE